jgi:YD repeat-containing protein
LELRGLDKGAEAYDNENRITQVTDLKLDPPKFACDEIGTYTYDGGNRLKTAADTKGSGTITQQYDFLDRLTSETTLQGARTRWATPTPGTSATICGRLPTAAGPAP